MSLWIYDATWKVTDCFCVCMMYESRLFNPHIYMMSSVVASRLRQGKSLIPCGTFLCYNRTLIMCLFKQIYPIWTRRFVGVARMMRSVVRLERMPKSFTKICFKVHCLTIAYKLSSFCCAESI